MLHSYANVCKNITGAYVTLSETIPPLAHSYVRVGHVIFYELCCNRCILLYFHQTRAVWCYCSDKVYLYQLMVKSALFYTLREWSALVNEMLLMMAGDVEFNPGPASQVNHQYL